MPSTLSCDALWGLRTRESKGTLGTPPAPLPALGTRVTSDRRVEWMPPPHTHTSHTTAPRVRLMSPPQPGPIGTRFLCWSPGNRGFPKGSGFSQAPQLEHGEPGSHPRQGDSGARAWEKGAKSGVGARVGPWVRVRGERRSPGRLAGRELLMVTRGAWGKGFRAGLRAQSLAHTSPAPYRVCDWTFLCLGFLICRVDVAAIAPAPQDGCEHRKPSVCYCLVFVFFLVTSEETEALRGEASP